MSLHRDEVFDHIAVDRISAGGARVTWRLWEHFHGRAPLVFQLQAGESGVPEATDWTTVATGTNVGTLLDATSRKDLDPVPRTHYRLRLTDADNIVSVSKPIPCEGNLNRRDWLRARSDIRVFFLDMRTGEGVDGWIFRQIRKMAPSTDPLQVHPLLGYVINSNGNTLGTDHTGGFFAASPMRMNLPAAGPRDNKIDPERGQVNDLVRVGLAVAFPQLSQGDVWASAHNDERYAIGKVEVKQFKRDVPLIVQIEMARIPASAPIYSIALPTPPLKQTIERAEL